MFSESIRERLLGVVIRGCKLGVFGHMGSEVDEDASEGCIGAIEAASGEDRFELPQQAQVNLAY